MITVQDMERLGFEDDSSMQDMKRFVICHGVRVLFLACEGPLCWKPELWTGDALKSRRMAEPTRDEVVQLCKALRVACRPE